MPRLIDANALLRKICGESCGCEPEQCGFIDEYRHERCKAGQYVANAPTVDGWISVRDRLPAETHSIFWPWYGRKEWSNAMWREQSDKVLVTVTFKDGTRLVTTGETHDGEWHTSISKTLNPIVTHWMQLPEPPKEDDDDEAD